MIGLGILVAVVAILGLAAAVGLGFMALGQIRQLRRELDETQRQLNEVQAQLTELQAANAAIPAPPLPRTRSSSLDDLRQQLRQAHSEPDDSPSE